MAVNFGYKLINFQTTFNSLAVAVKRDWLNDNAYRDSLIRRFNFAVSTCHKFYSAYLASMGVTVFYPKEVFRNIFQAQVLDESETVLCLEMLDDCNLIPYAYEEEVAAAIADRIVSYEPVLAKLAAKATELVS